jgi:hypothetical protein
MILSDSLTYADVFPALDELGRRLGRPINPTIYTTAELAQRVARGDSFISRVMQQPKVWIVGNERALAT